MTAGDHLRAIRGRWHIVVAAVVVAVAVAWWSAPGRTPAATYSDPEQVHVESYTATHTLIQDLAPGGASQTPTLNVKLLGALAQRGDIPRRVVERLGLEEAPAAVASRLQITPEPDLGMITITASEPDGERAAQLANAFGEEILAYAGESAEALRQDALEFTRTLVASQRRRIEELNAAISRLPQDSQDAELVVVERDALLAAYGRSLSRLEDLSTGAASPGLVTLTAAVPIPVIAEAGGSSPIQAVSDPTTRLRLAILIGLLLGAGLALLLERVDPRVRSRRQAEEAFGLPVIADVRVRGRVAGALRRWFARRRPTMSAVATAAVPYERLRLDVQRRPRWVLPPPSPGAGLPDAAPRVSALAVHDPVRVVLVTSAVDGEGRAEVFEQLASSFRAAGNEVASIVDQGGGARSAERLRAARDRFDVVLVDGGPLLLASHAAAAISEVDAVVVVSRLGRTSMADAALAREQLAALQAPVLGVVLNGRRGSTGLLPTRGRPRRAGHAWVAARRGRAT
ncbi:MAG TPA: hypothetical protein VHF25_13515, partial [Nitriliruptorales bacterium]|nr:hypothetical protein [Nitriliruptorales bacterium]